MNKTYLLPLWFRRFFGLSGGQGYEGRYRWRYKVGLSLYHIGDETPTRSANTASRVRNNEVIQKYVDFKGAVPVRCGAAQRVYDRRYLFVTSSSTSSALLAVLSSATVDHSPSSNARYSTAYWDILHSFDFVSGINLNEIVFKDRRKLSINKADNVGS